MEDGEEEKDKEKEKDAEDKSGVGSDDDEEESANTGYTMGRLWVQGPTDEEAEGYLNFFKQKENAPDIKVTEIGEIISNGEMIVDSMGRMERPLNHMERKALEEGDRVLKGLEDWGYYDQPEEIEHLLSWLDRNGRRELKLYKDIEAVKDRIFLSMQSRKEDLDADLAMRKQEIEGMVEEEEEEYEKNRPEEEVEDEEEEEGDEDDSDDIVPRKRRRSSRRTSGRKKAMVKKEEDPQVKEDRMQKTRERIQEEMAEQIPQRVLEWTNSLAIETMGHTHYESQKKRGPRKGSRRT